MMRRTVARAGPRLGLPLGDAPLTAPPPTAAATEAALWTGARRFVGRTAGAAAFDLHAAATGNPVVRAGRTAFAALGAAAAPAGHWAGLRLVPGDAVLRKQRPRDEPDASKKGEGRAKEKGEGGGSGDGDGDRGDDEDDDGDGEERMQQDMDRYVKYVFLLVAGVTVAAGGLYYMALPAGQHLSWRQLATRADDIESIVVYQRYVQVTFVQRRAEADAPEVVAADPSGAASPGAEAAPPVDGPLLDAEAAPADAPPSAGDPSATPSLERTAVTASWDGVVAPPVAAPTPAAGDPAVGPAAGAAAPDAASIEPVTDASSAAAPAAEAAAEEGADAAPTEEAAPSRLGYVGIRGSSSQEVEQRLREIMALRAEGSASVPVPYVGTSRSEVLLSTVGVVAWVVPFIFTPLYITFLSHATRTVLADALKAMARQSGGEQTKKSDLFKVAQSTHTRFGDIAGMTEAKGEVVEVVDFLKHPQRYQALGAKIPRGAMLLGPPGTGKTLLAKAVAGEADVSFIACCGSDFVEMYVGMGALRVRQLFEMARKQKKCIIYIDEIDAIGMKRGGGGNGEAQEQEHTLNELLTQLDGFATAAKGAGEVIIMASSNVAQSQLDPALIRPGRFDRIIHVEAPVLTEREEIFKVHIDKLRLTEPLPEPETKDADAEDEVEGAAEGAPNAAADGQPADAKGVATTEKADTADLKGAEQQQDDAKPDSTPVAPTAAADQEKSAEREAQNPEPHAADAAEAPKTVAANVPKTVAANVPKTDAANVPKSDAANAPKTEADNAPKTDAASATEADQSAAKSPKTDHTTAESPNTEQAPVALKVDESSAGEKEQPVVAASDSVPAPTDASPPCGTSNAKSTAQENSTADPAAPKADAAPKGETPAAEAAAPAEGDAEERPPAFTGKPKEEAAEVGAMRKQRGDAAAAELEERRKVIITDMAGRMSNLCPGFVGADIANVCNEGAILAAREGESFVRLAHLERSIDRVLAGIEHRGRVLSEFERTVVAHHEAGHAVAGWFLNKADPLMKVSIVPRGGSALGYAQYLPNESHLRSGDDVIDSMCVTLGGRVAEEIFFDHLSTGASDDLRKVTRAAYMHATCFGTSAVYPAPGTDQTAYRLPYGDATADEIDVAAKALVDEAHRRTHELLRAKKEEMAKLAEHLLKHEMLNHQDVVDYLGARAPRASDRKAV